MYETIVFCTVAIPTGISRANSMWLEFQYRHDLKMTYPVFLTTKYDFDYKIYLYIDMFLYIIIYIYFTIIKLDI